MKTPHRLGTAVVAAALGLSLPIGASAQQQPTMATPSRPADVSFSNFQAVMAHRAQTTQRLASLTQHVSSNDITTVPVNDMGWAAAQRTSLQNGMGDDGYRALQAALGKVIVSELDRSNGVSEDQNTLAEHLTHVGVNPQSVVAVDVQTRTDANNPRLTVYYRMQPNNPATTPAGT